MKMTPGPPSIRSTKSLNNEHLPCPSAAYYRYLKVREELIIDA